jgi:PleD family two-component response regulator
MRILVVDDSEDWRDLTEAALMAAGYSQVATAASATDAYGRLGLKPRTGDRTAAVDLVVLDLIMPEIDGIEACAQIRSDARYADVPVIMVTSAHDMDSLSSAFIAGATDYVTKPFNRVELLARVRSALKLKAELDRRKAREGELISLARSSWGDRDCSQWIDGPTGLLVGIAAEATLAAASTRADDVMVSVLALAVDRLDGLAAARGEATRDTVLARVAHAVNRTIAPIGVVACAYPDGVILLVAPQLPIGGARSLARSLVDAVAALSIPNPEAIAADHITVSIGSVTAPRCTTELVADARHLLKQAAQGGAERIVATDRTAH